MTLTTLCYIEKDDSYLMMHRIKKISTRINGSVLADILNPEKARKNACYAKPGKRPDLP